MKIKIAASILSADFGRINEEIKTVEESVDIMHIDVMDGHFVPNLTFGPPVIEKLKCARPMDVHLMIEHPEKYLDAFAKAVEKAHGKTADCYITVHQEACGNLPEVIKKIHDLDFMAGVSINPATKLDTILNVLNKADLVLLMTVNPGFGGQTFIESVLSKIEELRKLKPDFNIAVDGGINDETAQKAVKAGANILVAGSYIFHAKDRHNAIQSLKK